MIDYEIELPTLSGKQSALKRQRIRTTCGPIPIALQILTQIVLSIDDTPSIEVQSIDNSSRTRSYR